MLGPSGINFRKTYLLFEEFADVKERAHSLLDKYKVCAEIITFNDKEKSVSFTTERLVPEVSTNRPRVMLLFSNPHPHSICQGMFLSPSSKGRENLFWPIMAAAGWLPIPEENRSPGQLAETCIKVQYEGPFELIFFCYYAFPTGYPDDITKIFGREYFSQVIEPESSEEFRETVQTTSVKAVVTFNKSIFNLISKTQVDRYVNQLIQGKLIQSEVIGVNKKIPVFLTLPTGWRYHKQYMQIRKANLETIRTAILDKCDVFSNFFGDQLRE